MGLFLASTESGISRDPLSGFWYEDIAAISDSGIPITEQGALNISTVLKCVNWYFKMFGTLPMKLYERTTLFGRPAQVEARDHYLFPLIHTAPNPMMSAAYWHGLIAADLKLWGNSYAAIQRWKGSAEIRYLWRITPDKVRPAMVDGASGRKELRYYVRGDDGLEVPFYPDEILHVRGLGFDGIKGYSPIRLQMNLLGWNRATVRYGARFFKNASRPSGIISTEGGGPMKKEAKEGVVNSLRASGEDVGKLVLIEGAVKFHKLTMDQDEAQFISTAEFQEEDIAGFMEVKPHEIGILRRATNNNIENETISSVTRNIGPMCVNVEQWLDLQLLSDAPSTGRGGGTARERYFHQKDVKGLLRGDTAAQTEHITKMIEKTVYSPNDACNYLGVAPFEGGDRRFVNAAYVPLDMVDEVLRQRSQPKGSAPQKETASVHAPLLQASYGPIFKSAVERTLKRSKRNAATVFRPYLEGLSEGLGKQLDPAFLAEYLSALEGRAENWTNDDPEGIAMVELSRALAMILEKGTDAKHRTDLRP